MAQADSTSTDLLDEIESLLAASPTEPTAGNEVEFVARPNKPLTLDSGYGTEEDHHVAIVSEPQLGPSTIATTVSTTVPPTQIVVKPPFKPLNLIIPSPTQPQPAPSPAPRVTTQLPVEISSEDLRHRLLEKTNSFSTPVELYTPRLTQLLLNSNR